MVAEGEQIPLRPVTRPVTVESTDVAGANGIGVNGLAGGVNGLGGNVNGLGGVGEDSEDEPLVRKRKAKPETEPVEADGTGNGVPERGGGAGPTGRDPEDEPIRRGKLRKVAERKGGERPDDIFKREINEANGVKGVPGKGNEDGPAARSVGGKRKAEVSGSGRGDDAGAGLRLGLGGGFWVGLETASGAGRVLDLGFGTAGNDPKAGIQGTGIGVDASEAGMVQSEDEQRKRRKVNVVDLTTSEEETAEGETETEAEAKRRAEKGKAKVEQETEIEERGTTQTETEPEGGGTGEEEGGTGRTETELGLTGQTETESERGGTTETEPEPEQGGMGQTETEAEMRRRVVADDDPREVLAGRGKRKMRRLVDVLKIATAEEVLFEEAPRVGPREPPFLRPAKAAPAVKKPVGGKAAAKEKKPLGEKVIPDLEVPRDEKEIPSQTLNEGVGPSGTNANSAEALQGEAARSVGEDSHQAPTEPGPSGVNGHSPTESEDGVWSTPDSVFFDFDEVRKESDVLPGHYWALYDETDGMPRFYGRIDAVCANPFQVNLTWLEATEENRAAFYGRHPPLGAQSPKISPGTGEFKFGKTAQFDSINIFAYRQTAIQPLDGGAKLFPRCAEVWAMFDVERGAKRDRGGKEKAALQYELVEIVGIDGGYTVTKLMRLPRHPTLFQPVRGPNGRPLKVSVKPAVRFVGAFSGSERLFEGCLD